MPPQVEKIPIPILTLLNKVINNSIRDYASDLLPPLQQVQYLLCKRNIICQIQARRAKHKGSFYLHCLYEWNKLDPEIRLSPSVAVFKTKISSIFCPLKDLGFMTRRA